MVPPGARGATLGRKYRSGGAAGVGGFFGRAALLGRAPSGVERRLDATSPNGRCAPWGRKR